MVHRVIGPTALQTEKKRKSRNQKPVTSKRRAFTSLKSAELHVNEYSQMWPCRKASGP